MTLGAGDTWLWGGHDWFSGMGRRWFMNAYPRPGFGGGGVGFGGGIGLGGIVRWPLGSRFAVDVGEDVSVDSN